MLLVLFLPLGLSFVIALELELGLKLGLANLLKTAMFLTIFFSLNSTCWLIILLMFNLNIYFLKGIIECCVPLISGEFNALNLLPS